MKRFFKFRRDAIFCVSTVLMLLMLCCFQPAFATPTTPTRDFIDNGDGTVTHKLTGLIWQRCSMGQTWDKATSSCTGTATTYTYAEVMLLKATFAGKSDWRLPTMNELPSIVERENLDPAINKTLFPNTPNSRFWSSSPDASNSYYAGVVYFYYGNGSYADKSLSSVVRLVRGGQCILGSLPSSSTPNTDFTVNGDGSTVTHKCTGLTWMRCAVGQLWNGSTCTDTAKTYTYDQAMALNSGNSDWRVPNPNELHSIVDYSAYNPAINKDLFPNTPNSLFWSSSPLASYSDNAWVVYFSHGNDGGYGKDDSHFVRLVRGGQ